MHSRNDEIYTLLNCTSFNKLFNLFLVVTKRQWHCIWMHLMKCTNPPHFVVVFGLYIENIRFMPWNAEKETTMKDNKVNRSGFGTDSILPRASTFDIKEKNERKNATLKSKCNNDLTRWNFKLISIGNKWFFNQNMNGLIAASMIHTSHSKSRKCKLINNSNDKDMCQSAVLKST